MVDAARLSMRSAQCERLLAAAVSTVRRCASACGWVRAQGALPCMCLLLYVGTQGLPVPIAHASRLHARWVCCACRA